MKVENPFGTQLNKAVSTNSQSGKPDSTGTKFSEILENTRNGKAGEAASSAPTSNYINALDFNQVQKDAISRSEEALSLLNHLAGLLDGAASPSSIESMAGALDSSSKELLSIKEGLEQGDPLRQTIDQIAVLSTVEKIKITRGDYS